MNELKDKLVSKQKRKETIANCDHEWGDWIASRVVALYARKCRVCKKCMLLETKKI